MIKPAMKLLTCFHDSRNKCYHTWLAELRGREAKTAIKHKSQSLPKIG